MVDDYGRDHWKFNMDSLEFAYMLQPSVERPETPDQVTWVGIVADVAMPADTVP